VAVLGAAMLGIGLYVRHSVVERASATIMDRVIERVDQELANTRNDTLKTLSIAVRWAKTDWSGKMESDELEDFFSYLMLALPEAEFTHITRYSGDSFALRGGDAVWTSWLRRPEVWGDRMLVRHWTDDNASADERLEETEYDLAQAPWFAGAITRLEQRGRDAPLGELLFVSEPYESTLTGEMLISLSLAFEAIDGLPAVVGATVSAERITDMMRKTHIGEEGMMAYLYGEANKPDDVVVLGVPSDPRIETDADVDQVLMRPYSELGGPVAALFDEYLERGDEVLSAPIRFDSDGEVWWGRLEKRVFKELDEVLGQPRWYAVVVPEDQIQANLPKSMLFILAATAIVLVLAVFRASRLAEGYSQPIEQLVEQGRRMQRLDFRPTSTAKTNIREIRALADAFEGMRRALHSYTSINEEVRIADSILRATIPSSMPRPAGYQIEALRKSTEDAGGESFDVLVPDAGDKARKSLPKSASGAIAFLVLAPRGVGVEAAVTTAQLRAIFRTEARSGMEPRELVRKLDGYLSFDVRGDTAVGGWVGSLEPADARLSSVSAGCEAVLHFQAASGRFTRLGDTRVLLGDPGKTVRPSVHDIELGEGDIVGVATNGVIDALNVDRERFGMKRLEKVIADHHSEGASDILVHLEAEIDRFTEGMRATADKTALLIKRTEKRDVG
jgi:serine phosphatase RsbU (regulator of sigma subunit)